MGRTTPKIVRQLQVIPANRISIGSAIFAALKTGTPTHIETTLLRLHVAIGRI